MNLPGLALRNAFLRNKTRSWLTILGVMVAAFAFIFLRTVIAAWYAQSEQSAADRVVTRNAISLIQPLPLAYRDRIAQVPGVAGVTYMNWFGGIYQDRKNFFANFAMDPKTALDIMDIRLVQGSRADFENDRNSCLVGSELAKKYGFKIGGSVPLVSDIYPGDYRFRVAGIVEGDAAAVAQTLYFHWARLNEGRPEGQKNQVGLYTVKVANPSESPRVSRDIDALFANSDNETHTESEKSFLLGFVSGSQAILSALQAVSLVILVIMALILGNTMAMGLRERTSELGALRAIGFVPRHVQVLGVSEGILLGLTGGLLGVSLSTIAIQGFGRVVEGMGFLTGVRFNPLLGLATLLVAGAIGGLASAGPAWSASRMQVVAALRRQE